MGLPVLLCSREIGGVGSIRDRRNSPAVLLTPRAREPRGGPVGHAALIGYSIRPLSKHSKRTTA